MTSSSKPAAKKAAQSQQAGAQSPKPAGDANPQPKGDKTSPEAAEKQSQSEESKGSEENDNTPSQTGRPEDSGPQTGRPAPPESTYRPPATIVNSDSAPLDPPADTHTQTAPEKGFNLSSTDHVYAEAGGRTIAGEDHVGIVDADGNSVSEGSLFEDEPGKTFVTVKTRAYEEFYYPNTTEKARRLLFTEGQRVPRAQAERIKAAVKGAPDPAENRSSATAHRG